MNVINRQQKESIPKQKVVFIQICFSQTTHMRPYDAEGKLEDTKEETETENIWS